MINSNIDFLGNPNRVIKSKVEIYEASTLLHTIYDSDEIIDFTIDRQGQCKFFGFGVCHKLNLHTLNRNNSIVYDTSKSLKVYLQNYSFYPTFYITEKHLDETTGKLSITAYDALYAAGNHIISEVFAGGVRNKTQEAVATAIANFLGLAGFEYRNINDELLHIGMSNESTFDSDISLRKALDIIAESLCASYYINNENKLVFYSFAKSNAVAEITKEDYIDFTTGDNKRLTKIERVNELEDSEFVETSLTGTTQFIRENPYFENRPDILDVLDAALASVGNATLTQFELLWRGNPNIEVFDKAKIEDKNGVQQEIVIYNDTITYNGGLTQKTSWKYEDTEDESGNNPASLGEVIKQTYAKVDKVNREIKLVVSDVEDALDAADEALEAAEDATGRVSQLKIDLDGVKTTVRDVSNTVNGYSSRIGEIEATANNVTLSVERIDSSIIDIETDIDDLADGIEQNAKDIAAINVTAESITSTVESVRGIAENAAADVSTLRDDVVAANDETFATIEALESKITQTAKDLKIEFNATIGDIDSVTTSTGFTFDADGLKVEKSGSEMSTQITEDGMTVYRNDEEMLVADHRGVNAVNLHASTYLIVGYNSRFEDMGNRTGCFWIGG